MSDYPRKRNFRYSQTGYNRSGVQRSSLQGNEEGLLSRPYASTRKRNHQYTRNEPNPERVQDVRGYSDELRHTQFWSTMRVAFDRACIDNIAELIDFGNISEAASTEVRNLAIRMQNEKYED